MIKIRRGCLSGSRLWKGPKQIQEIWFRSLAFHRISLSRLDSRDFDLTLQNEILGITRSFMLDVANGNESCAI